jgi:hypothetical protein
MLGRGSHRLRFEHDQLAIWEDERYVDCLSDGLDM